MTCLICYDYIYFLIQSFAFPGVSNHIVFTSLVFYRLITHQFFIACLWISHHLACTLRLPCWVLAPVFTQRLTFSSLGPVSSFGSTPGYLLSQPSCLRFYVRHSTRLFFSNAIFDSHSAYCILLGHLAPLCDPYIYEFFALNFNSPVPLHLLERWDLSSGADFSSVLSGWSGEKFMCSLHLTPFKLSLHKSPYMYLSEQA